MTIRVKVLRAVTLDGLDEAFMRFLFIVVFGKNSLTIVPLLPSGLITLLTSLNCLALLPFLGDSVRLICGKHLVNNRVFFFIPLVVTVHRCNIVVLYQTLQNVIRRRIVE